MSRPYRDLVVWQRAVQLSIAIYKLTAAFPKQEMLGLTSQLRRAGVSVPSNIAEGYGRGSRGEYKQFLSIARGSIFELQTQIQIAKELGYGSPGRLEEISSLSNEIKQDAIRPHRQVVGRFTKP